MAKLNEIQIGGVVYDLQDKDAAKFYVGTSAPTDTTALWIDTDDGGETLTPEDIGALPITGGKMTGALNVNDQASIDTNGYVKGTWLYMSADTSLGSAPTQGVCVKQGGWIYTRTLDQLRGDIGAVNEARVQEMINSIAVYNGSVS